MSLPPFPANGIRDKAACPDLVERGCSLRQLHADDLPWLQDLYASTRDAEMAALAWPDESKRAFLDQQFALQHRHYLSHFAGARFLAIEHQTHGPIGRLYLQCSAPRHVLIDIGLLPAYRHQGIGRALIMQCQDEAAVLGHGMALHVLHTNLGAQRLYQRLGFQACESTASHCLMVWPAEGEPARIPASTAIE